MRQNTVIPAIRSFKELEKALSAPCDTIFLLESELIHLKSIVDTVRRCGKKVFLHLDLIKGLKEDEASIHYLVKEVKTHGIISTRTSSLLNAKKYGLITVQRGFLIDSQSLKTIINSAKHVKPDYIELLPSFSHPKLGEIKRDTGVDIILGGFIDKKESLPELFASGAVAVSTSNKDLWHYAH